MLNCCGDIFDEISGKKKEQIQGRTSRRRPIFNATIQLDVVNLYTKYDIRLYTRYDHSSLHVVEKSLTKNFILPSLKGKQIGQIQGRIRREGWFSIPRCNKSSSASISNMTILACILVDKSLTKNFFMQNMEGKKIGRIRLVLYSTIQHVIINMRFKSDYSSLHSCGKTID